MKYGCIFQNRRVWWDGAGCGSGSTVWVWSDEESTIGPLLLLRAMWEASGEALRAGRVRVRPQDGGAPLQEALGSLQMPLLGGLWLPGLGDVCSLPEASCSESG